MRPQVRIAHHFFFFFYLSYLFHICSLESRLSFVVSHSVALPVHHVIFSLGVGADCVTNNKNACKGS